MWKVSAKRLAVGFFLLVAHSVGVSQEPADSPPSDSDKIAALVQSYVAAFNDGDVEKLSKHWVDDGIYVSLATGEEVVGREAIAAQFQQIFSQEMRPKLNVATESIDFVSPNVALEKGTATVTYGDDPPMVTRYRTVLVEHDGTWLIDRVSEDTPEESAGNESFLQPLEPLMGTWSHQNDDVHIQLECDWTKNRNFISRKFKVTNKQDGEVELSGLQIVGWDAAQEQIRSWLFDSDGTVVEGTWSPKEDHWVVLSKATFHDGGRASYTTLLRPLEDGNLSWEKINQMVDGELLPNQDEVIFERN